MPIKDVEIALAKVAQDFNPLERVDVGVQVFHANLGVAHVGGEILGKPLGQGRH